MTRTPHVPAGFSFSSSASTRSADTVADVIPRPQAAPVLTDGIHVGRVWKSPRDKTRSIEGVLHEFNGSGFAEFREYTMDGHGKMVPTDKRLTVSVKRLGQFAALFGDAYRRAEAMGLTPRST